ncbi:MAG TPA: hypothetical protein VJK51_03765 [Candidatus Nanoarchaeia archaeon]|nr:hypothetical protein [Candidatus Nanoarchaeia archaeon]
MRRYLLVFVFLFFVAGASALTIRESDERPVVISQVSTPAVYHLEIDSEAAQSVELYSLIGVSMSPKGTFDLQPGNNSVEVRAYLPEGLRRRPGIVAFSYELKGSVSGITKGKLFAEIVDLEESLELETQHLLPGDSEGIVVLKNLKGAQFDDLTLSVSSLFFEGSSNLSLSPFGEATLRIPITNSEIKEVVAGPYVVKGIVTVNGKKFNLNGVIDYLEKEGISVSSETSGFLIRKTNITKLNEGNKVSIASIEETKDIFSRLFSAYSIEPQTTERKGIMVYYTWQKELKPNESFSVGITTNYTLPFVFLLLVLFSGFFARLYFRTAVVAEKQVSYVKTKGGEFALKVVLTIRAKKSVDQLVVRDQLPVSTSLYEQFGTKPDAIAGRSLQWKIHSLGKGESRVISYIFYSSLRVVGSYGLPPAHVSFVRNGKHEHVSSNSAFFMSETMKTSWS